MKHKKALIGFIVGVIFMFGLGWLYLEKTKPVSEYEKNVNAITEISKEEQQEQLNQIVAEGQINIQYSPYVSFNGAVSESFNVKNIKNNHHPLVFSLYDEHEKMIYESKQIEPGYEINSIKLTKELPKGTHDCTIKIGYVTEGNVSSVFPITIEVK